MGNRIAQQLAAAALPNSQASMASFESSEAEFDIDGDSDLEGLMEITDDIDQQFDDVDSGIGKTEGLTGLVDSFISKFDDGVDEAHAELLEVSVEAYMKVAGINVPVRTFLPEWVSADTYSTEVEDRQNNFFGRFIRWIRMALEAVKTTLARYWDKLVINVDAIKAYAQKVKKLVESIPANRRINKDGEISLGVSSLWLSDRNGTVRTPDVQIIETVTRFDDFVREWATQWDPIINVPREPAQAAKQLHDAMLLTQYVKGGKYDFSSTHYVHYEPGKGQFPLLDARVSIGTDVSTQARSGPILTYREMTDGISAALASFTELNAIKRQIDKYSSSLNVVKHWADSTDSARMAQIDGKLIAGSSKTLSKGCSLASWGVTPPTASYLKTIKACIRYIEASANRY